MDAWIGGTQRSLSWTLLASVVAAGFVVDSVITRHPVVVPREGGARAGPETSGTLVVDRKFGSLALSSRSATTGIALPILACAVVLAASYSVASAVFVPLARRASAFADGFGGVCANRRISRALLWSATPMRSVRAAIEPALSPRVSEFMPLSELLALRRIAVRATVLATPLAAYVAISSARASSPRRASLGGNGGNGGTDVAPGPVRAHVRALMALVWVLAAWPS